MKKTILLLATLLSFSASATEISETKCDVSYQYQSKTVTFSNELRWPEKAVVGNCLELAKEITKDNTLGFPVHAVVMNYKLDPKAER